MMVVKEMDCHHARLHSLTLSDKVKARHVHSHMRRLHSMVTIRYVDGQDITSILQNSSHQAMISISQPGKECSFVQTAQGFTQV